MAIDHKEKLISGGRERIDRTTMALKDKNLDALVCALPTNVLMLTGYFPVVGTSIALASRDGQVCLFVPEDEAEFARRGWASEISTFKPGSLEDLTGAVDVVEPILRESLSRLGLNGKRVGCEYGPHFQPSSYASMHLYGASLIDLLDGADVHAAPADAMISRLRAVKTPDEIERIRRSCAAAERAYSIGRQHLQPGLREREAANLFESQREELELSDIEAARVGGYVFCMAGENSLNANAAYQRSSGKVLRQDEFVVVHCNSHADGYWTDITRTYFLGTPDEKRREMYAAVFEAREAAMAAIRPGVAAADVDGAARGVLTSRGFGEFFKHGTGHGVGFAAIDHGAIPRLHPASPDVLEAGMTFNVEPAIYIEPASGMRHCDMVAVTDSGCEVLTPFHTEVNELTVEVGSAASGRAAI